MCPVNRAASHPARSVKPDSPFSERLAYFERKANLLSAIAQDLDTADPVRVSAAWVSDADIRAMYAACSTAPRPRYRQPA